ncbi:hypothetical protein TNCV_1082071 [Trichonephila clavipes]|nr:hypothetical protein TNCV_1082071 [Trichonephila clavipes]
MVKYWAANTGGLRSTNLTATGEKVNSQPLAPSRKRTLEVVPHSKAKSAQVSRSVVRSKCFGTLSSTDVGYGRAQQTSHSWSPVEKASLPPTPTSMFPIGNRIFQWDSVQRQKAGMVLESFEEYKDEFQLIS